MKKLKNVLKKTWLGKAARKVLRPSKVHTFNNSADYWETRYKNKDHSGAGSYGRLAEYKAEIINEFVSRNTVSRVLEFGVGDGNQLSLADYPHFIGLDVSPTAIAKCKRRFENDSSKEFYLMDEVNPESFNADLTMSLDVIYHLVEDDIFEQYMRQLFDSSKSYVIVYSSNYDQQSAVHVRSRKFTDWIDDNAEGWELLEFIKNRYPFDAKDPEHTSIADFYIYQRKN